MPTLKESVARNLSRILREKNIKQVDLARALSVTPKTINGYINGRSGISVDMIAKLASALNVEETDLTSPYKSGSDREVFQQVNQVFDKLFQQVDHLKIDLSDPTIRQTLDFVSALNKDQRPKFLSLIKLFSNPSIRQIIEIFSTLDQEQRAKLLLTIEGIVEVMHEQASLKSHKQAK